MTTGAVLNPFTGQLQLVTLTLSLTSEVTGILPIANGGTNSSASLNNNRLMVSSSSAIVEAAAITASRALISDSNGIPTHSSVTDTELGYVSGVSSAIQTQLDGKMTNPMTTGGDIIYGGASGTPTRLANGAAGQVLRSSGGTSAPTWANTSTANYRYGPCNGYGATNTRIRKYTSTLVAPTDTNGLLTVVNDANDGFSVTAAKACVVTITATDNSATDGSRFGISLNSNQLTTNYQSISTANQLVLGMIPQANYSTSVTVTIPLAVNDVLRVHGDGTSAASVNTGMVCVSAIGV